MFDNPRKATTAAGGVVGAILIFLTETLAYWGIRPSASWISAASILLMAVAARYAHPAQEDAAALHRRILARLDADERLPSAELETPAPASVLSQGSSPGQQYAREASDFLRILKRPDP